MATFTASAAQAAAPALMNVNGTIDRVIRFSQSASFSAGDVIQMMKIPSGAIVTDVSVACSFSAGVATVNIGDGNDVSAYGASVVLSGTVTLTTTVPSRGWGRSYSAEDTVDIQIATISTPPANALLILKISYTMHNGSGQ